MRSGVKGVPTERVRQALEDIVAKTRKKSKGTSTGRKPNRVARKPAKVSWLAKGYPVLSSVTVLDECARAIDWYKNVLGAKQRLRLEPCRAARWRTASSGSATRC